MRLAESAHLVATAGFRLAHRLQCLPLEQGKGTENLVWDSFQRRLVSDGITLGEEPWGLVRPPDITYGSGDENRPQVAE